MAVLPVDAVGERTTTTQRIPAAFGQEKGGSGTIVIPYARSVGSQGETDRQISGYWRYQARGVTNNRRALVHILG